MKIQRLTYLSLGSNQGEKLKNLQKAIYEIAESVGAIQKISSIYKTSSWGYEGEDFYNISISVSTYLQPDSLLKKLLTIESNLGRERKNLNQYTDRKIDIDILLFDDEIIFSKKITIPHPRMLERKFVLVPLVEIAKNSLHPIEKKQLYVCLNNCSDASSIEKISSKLIRPIPLTEKYNYIAIEGNIGAGKTSLASLMSDEFNARVVLERFADNPFLPKFYEDKERFAFPLEMSFLADRYQQLSDDLAQFNLFKNLIVSDYYIFKSLIFAQITLQKEEYALYRKMFDNILKPLSISYRSKNRQDLNMRHFNFIKLLLNIVKREFVNFI